MLRKIAKFLSSGLKSIRLSLEISGTNVAVRRYFFSNSFDGVLTVTGLCLGAAVAPGTKVSTVVFAGLGASIAMLVSGFTGIYVTESAETRRRVREIEESMLRDVSDTIIGRAGLVGPLIASLIGGLSTFLLSLTVLLPYIVSLYMDELQPYAVFLSPAVGFMLLFVLGLFLGKFSKIDMVKTGLKMLGMGVVTAVMILLMELLLSL